MVEYSFDGPALESSWMAARGATPLECANFLWFAYTAKLPDEINCTAEAIERAEWDHETWDALREWALKKKDLNDELKAAMHDLWLNPRPSPTRKGKPMPTKYRDIILRRIAATLRRDFGLTNTINPATQNKNPDAESIAIVLSELFDKEPDVKQIERILRG